MVQPSEATPEIEAKKQDYVIKVLFLRKSIDKTLSSREYEESVRATLLIPWHDLTVCSIRKDPEGPVTVFVDRPFTLEACPDGSCRIKAFKGQKQ